MKTTSFALGVAALAAVLCSGVCAEKITADPNKNGGSTTNLEVKESVPDLRLAKKITYTSTDKRLHTVLEELSKETGVDIQSGKNADDWPVRDIPLVVSVKDLPLGKLLQAIADATHLALTTSTVKDINHYRIWRSPMRQDQLTNYFKTIEDTKKAKLSAQWDAWGKLKAISKSIPSITSSKEGEIDRSAMLQSTIGIMAALPEGSKEAVMSGKLLSFDMQSSSPQLARALKGYYQNLKLYERSFYEWQLTQPKFRPKPPREMSESEMETIKFAIGKQQSFNQSLGSEMAFDGRSESKTLSRLYVGLDSSAVFEGSFDVWPLPVSGDEALSLLDEHDPFDNLEPLVTNCSRSLCRLEAEHSQISSLDKTFVIPKPKKGTERTYAEVIADIAKASGYSIVCEDFYSQAEEISGNNTKYYSTFFFTFYDEEVTLRSILLPPADMDPDFDAYDSSKIYWHSQTDWLVDSPGNLLVGWHPMWWSMHRALAPEKLVSGLIKKLNSDGLEVDDVAATLLLPADQYSVWIAGNKNINFQFSGAESHIPFWKMYANLSIEDKALAKSNDGLPLANLKSKDVVAVFKGSAKKISGMSEVAKFRSIMNWMRARPEMESRMQAWAMQHYPQSNPENTDEASAKNTQKAPDIAEMLKSLIETFPEVKVALEPPPTDPAKVLKLKMRLAKVDFGGSKAMMMSGGVPAGEGEKKPHKYSLTFEGDGIKVEAGSLGSIYPIYSEKRSRELIAEQKKKSEKKESTKPAESADKKPK